MVIPRTRESSREEHLPSNGTGLGSGDSRHWSPAHRRPRTGGLRRLHVPEWAHGMEDRPRGLEHPAEVESGRPVPWAALPERPTPRLLLSARSRSAADSRPRIERCGASSCSGSGGDPNQTENGAFPQVTTRSEERDRWAARLCSATPNPSSQDRRRTCQVTKDQDLAISAGLCLAGGQADRAGDPGPRTVRQGPPALLFRTVCSCRPRQT
jgi:hypothetical protein